MKDWQKIALFFLCFWLFIFIRLKIRSWNKEQELEQIEKLGIQTVGKIVGCGKSHSGNCCKDIEYKVNNNIYESSDSHHSKMDKCCEGDTTMLGSCFKVKYLQENPREFIVYYDEPVPCDD